MHMSIHSSGGRSLKQRVELQERLVFSNSLPNDALSINHCSLDIMHLLQEAYR